MHLTLSRVHDQETHRHRVRRRSRAWPRSHPLARGSPPRARRWTTKRRAAGRAEGTVGHAGIMCSSPCHTSSRRSRPERRRLSRSLSRPRGRIKDYRSHPSKGTARRYVFGAPRGRRGDQQPHPAAIVPLSICKAHTVPRRCPADTLVRTGTPTSSRTGFGRDGPRTAEIGLVDAHWTPPEPTNGWIAAIILERALRWRVLSRP